MILIEAEKPARRYPILLLSLSFGLLTLFSLFVSAIPAWRASRVDPNQALREE